MQIIVTGGAGFIGSNIVNHLFQQGVNKIIVVDDLEDGNKFINIKGVPIYDFCDKNEFIDKFKQKYWGRIDAVFHQGACTSTVESNGNFMLNNNYHYSKYILEICQNHKIPLIYASSASVYGLANLCLEDNVNPNPKNKKSHQPYPQTGPINIYGYSKWLFDQHFQHHQLTYRKKSIPVVGLRYFNVYGEREQHKGRMASVVFHLHQQLVNKKPMKLFGEYDGYHAGEQKRDFIYVGDVVAVNSYFLDRILAGKSISGIFNCGCGKAREFNEIARALYQNFSKSKSKLTATDLVSKKKLAYIPFPDDLKGKYQSYTQADLNKLRSTGYHQEFTNLDQGIAKYWKWLEMVNG